MDRFRMEDLRGKTMHARLMSSANEEYTRFKRKAKTRRVNFVLSTKEAVSFAHVQEVLYRSYCLDVEDLVVRDAYFNVSHIIEQVRHNNRKRLKRMGRFERWFFMKFGRVVL